MFNVDKVKNCTKVCLVIQGININGRAYVIMSFNVVVAVW